VLREDGARIVDNGRFCSPVVLLGARGTDENLPDGNFRHGTGDAVRNTWRLLAQQAGVLPEDESVNPTVIGATATAYPATISRYMASVAQGVSDLAQMMADVRRHCPRSRLVLVGFSQGADVVDTTWATLPIGARLVIGVIGHADPRFDRDWITQGIARPEGVDFSYEGPGLGRGPLPSVPRALTQQWCYPSDPVCQSSQPLAIIDWSHWHGPAYEGYEQWAAYALAPAVIEVLGHHGYPTVVPTEPQTPPTTS